jgi:drug/metabolite transporter (DMT)-like permease
MIASRKKLLAVVALITATVVWGGGFIVMKNSLDSLTPQYLLASRSIIGTIGMCIIFHKKLNKITKQDIKCGFILGLLLFLAFTFQTYGLKYTTASKNAFLTTAYVVLVPFTGWIIKRKKPDIYSFIGTIICIIGIGLLSLEGDLTLKLGDGLTLICAVFYAIHITYIDTFTEKHSPIVLTILQLGFMALLCTITAVLFEPFPTGISSNAVVGLLYLGLFATMLAFLCQNVGQKYTSPATASILLSFESVFGCIFSIIFLHEYLTLKMFIGCVLIFSSLMIVETKLSFLKPKVKKITQA